MITLARAKCPRCGFVVVAASTTERDALCRAHDWEAHQDPSLDEVRRACNRTDIRRGRAVLARLARFRRRRQRQTQGGE
jgi:hypothetical protein